MKFLSFLILLSLSFATWAQGGPVKHPRVAEVEEKMRDEASRYFTRRFPNEPFFIKVEVNPLRRDMVSGQKMESLPYFDYESEESVDEWDDPKTPMSFLRHRVTKVVLEIDVPESFNESRVAEIKEEISAYLKLLPFRDDVRVVRKLKVESPPLVPVHYYSLLAGGLICALLLGLLVRSGLSKMRPASNPQATAPVAAAQSFNSSNQPRERASKSSSSASGVTTMHDPLKTVDIVHLKIEQIEKSGTFPTLGDIMSLHAMGEESPSRLGALLYEMPVEWQKRLFPLGHGQEWLEAFSQPGPVDHECLVMLDRVSKERSFAASSRESENLLIQIWRMGEKGGAFFKKIPQEHAFNLLHMLPKSHALGIAKKAFPGAWGRLLENVTAKIVLTPDVISTYMNDALAVEPYYEWRMLENYRKDRELLKYLDTVSIDDEKDIYNTLNAESFIFKVRPAFYRVFEQEGDVWKTFVAQYPLQSWALVVMNSPRQYIRQVMDALDEKQKVVYSQHLKNFDQGFDSSEQSDARRLMAAAMTTSHVESEIPKVASEDEGAHAQSA